MKENVKVELECPNCSETLVVEMRPKWPAMGQAHPDPNRIKMVDTLAPDHQVKIVT